MGKPLVSRFKSGLLRGLAGVGAAVALIGIGAWLKETLDLRFVAGVAWTVLFFALTVGWVLATRPPEVAVGADGVRIRGRVGSRFVALSEIASAKVEGLSSLVLGLKDGKTERVDVALGNLPMLHALVHRIERALSGAEGAATETRLSLLRRGERTIAAWKEALRAHVRNADYRHAALADLDLERIVGSPGATAEHRIGAAIALKEGGSDTARDRIRIAAEQCVNPQVRVALERIADADAEGEADAAAVEDALGADAPSPRRAEPTSPQA
jgi:hypothetical protein